MFLPLPRYATRPKTNQKLVGLAGSAAQDRMSMANALFASEPNKLGKQTTSSINLCINQKAPETMPNCKHKTKWMQSQIQSQSQFRDPLGFPTFTPHLCDSSEICKIVTKNEISEYHCRLSPHVPALAIFHPHLDHFWLKFEIALGLIF